MDTEPNFNELLRYDPETGGLYWRVRVSHSRAPAGAEAGYISSGGYRQVKIRGKAYKTHRLVWMLAHGLWPKHDIDHIDGDRLNNRQANLRDVPTRINMRNARRSNANTSGFVGVTRRRTKPNLQGWAAHWYDNEGKYRSKFFSVNKYGEEAAKQMALDYRAAQIKGMGYTARHGL